MPQPIEAITPKTELLLTSAGPTTEAIQEKLLEIGKGLGKLHGLSILRIADGWVPFSSSDGVALHKRVEQRGESLATRLWSSRYIGHVLTGAIVKTYNIGALAKNTAANVVEQTDIILVPGGNTYQTIRGVGSHREILRKAIGEGKPYIGESAGSIIAGQSTKPASLEPADTYPTNFLGDLDEALGLVNVDIMAHASGRTKSFTIPGVMSLVASNVLKGYETPSETLSQFTADRHKGGVGTVALNDTQALSVSGSIITIL